MLVLILSAACWQSRTDETVSDIPLQYYFQVFTVSHMQHKGVNRCFDRSAGQAWLYEDNPNCTDTAAAYVMGDLTGTLCSLTKAFLFKSIRGQLPGNHSHRMTLCPSGEEEENKEQKGISLCYHPLGMEINSPEWWR